MSGNKMQTPPHPKRTGKQQFKCLVLGAAGAGKTSLLRRYFYKQFNYERMPTLGSDFYVGRVPNPGSVTNDQTTVNVQMWDTPGKENFARKRQRHVHYSATLSDSFFQHADAIMLVYDMTSSTSFTRLLKWYGDLMELFTKSKALPILIVANKLDLFQADKPGARHPPKSVLQRDVLGITGTCYYGKNFQYEYQICRQANDVNRSMEGLDNKNIATLPKKIENSDYKRSGKRRMEISSYLVNRENWTTDGSYLESLLHSEDGSHPDREMVLLWCMRNGIKMVEISAATGEGVDDAVEALVLLALEASSKDANGAAKERPGCLSSSYSMPHTNKELDLHQRYANKDENCFFCFTPLRRCWN